MIIQLIMTVHNLFLYLSLVDHSNRKSLTFYLKTGQEFKPWAVVRDSQQSAALPQTTRPSRQALRHCFIFNTGHLMSKWYKEAFLTAGRLSPHKMGLNPGQGIWKSSQWHGRAVIDIYFFSIRSLTFNFSIPLISIRFRRTAIIEYFHMFHTIL